MANAAPWVKFEEISENAGRFIVSPLNRGMGSTLGNSMRRVLLSSLSGAAITSLQIEGVEHEFSTMENVVEDALDIIFNVKAIVFKLKSGEPKNLEINFSGKGVVKASDIKHDSDVEIINPDQPIAQLSEKGKLQIRLRLEKGVGYSPAESRSDDEQDIRTINVDASFSPIIRVNHTVENIRVGKELDYDQLTLDVHTNGSIRPDEAVQKAAEILTRQVQLFGYLNQKPEDEVAADLDLQDERYENALNLSIDDLELSARSSNCLKRAGIKTVRELMDRGLSELIKIKNFGKKSADEINDKLRQYGLVLPEMTAVKA